MIACGKRKAEPSLDAVAAAWEKRATVVVLPEVTKTDNLGALLRISAAFGADAVILGRAMLRPVLPPGLRVSMGAVFMLPIVQSQDLCGRPGCLHKRWGVELVATVLDEAAQPLARPAARPPAGPAVRQRSARSAPRAPGPVPPAGDDPDETRDRFAERGCGGRRCFCTISRQSAAHRPEKAKWPFNT